MLQALNYGPMFRCYMHWIMDRVVKQLQKYRNQTLWTKCITDKTKSFVGSCSSGYPRVPCFFET